MDIQIFSDLFTLGLTPIPVKWDEKTKQASIHPEHGNKNEAIKISNVEKWIADMNGCNGLALKLTPPFGMVDIDQKNSDRKNIFTEWLEIIQSNSEDIMRKICIEGTRNGGHHIYIKYPELSHKVAIARNDGQEVISIYTGGLLSYCYPTPGYNLIHNDFSDIEELTKDEYDIIVGASAYFNDDKDFKPGSNTVGLIEYPIEYEGSALYFDNNCTGVMFEHLIESMGLIEVKDDRHFKNKLYVPYLRKGSSGTYSAKAYYENKRLLLFSASMKGFPTWHDRVGEGGNIKILNAEKC